LETSGRSKFEALLWQELSLIIIATYRSKPGKEADLAACLKAMMAPTRAEEGCETYRVIRSNDDPATFVLFESYSDADALDAHRSSEHFNTHIRNGAWKIIDSRDVVSGSEIEG